MLFSVRKKVRLDVVCQKKVRLDVVCQKKVRLDVVCQKKGQARCCSLSERSG